MITIRYFASLRERLGSVETLPAQDGLTISALRAQLVARGGVHAEALAPGKLVRCALDKTMCAEDVLVPDGAEVAFFPPVTGG